MLVGLEGGVASGIDWRDLDISGTTTLTAAGPGGRACGCGRVNVNYLLGSPGEPAATSADFVGLSATIAAHELGHLSGLEHGDSYGPIGSGIYDGVTPTLYNPPYPGPTDADETILHIMASGASVHATLLKAINDPFFGEREAIKLAFGEDGTPTNEQTTPHYTIADAQPIALRRWSCPTPTSRASTPTSLRRHGRRRGRLYGAGGRRQTPRPTITRSRRGRHLDQPGGHVGGPGPPQGAFDTTLTVYDSNGNVIAYNDDSFQDTDSTILDLTLPTTGTYYVEVTASAKEGGADRADRGL